MSRWVFALVCAGAAAAQAGATEPDGEAVYNRHCIHCHAAGDEMPGTLQLAKRRGEESAVLSERKDLVDAYIVTVVRNGLNAMPPFTPSDLDAAKLEALVEFLTAN